MPDEVAIVEALDDHGYADQPAWETDHLEPAIGCIVREMTAWLSRPYDRGVGES